LERPEGLNRAIIFFKETFGTVRFAVGVKMVFIGQMIDIKVGESCKLLSGYKDLPS
jgi:hypothetical protein